jgi:hypothetical protein
LVPASCSRRIPMICSSVNLFRFIIRLPHHEPDSKSIWKKPLEAGQQR